MGEEREGTPATDWTVLVILVVMEKDRAFRRGAARVSVGRRITRPLAERDAGSVAPLPVLRGVWGSWVRPSTFSLRFGSAP